MPPLLPQVQTTPASFKSRGPRPRNSLCAAEILSTIGGNSLAEGEILSAPSKGLICLLNSLRSKAAHEHQHLFSAEIEGISPDGEIEMSFIGVCKTLISRMPVLFPMIADLSIALICGSTVALAAVTSRRWRGSMNYTLRVCEIRPSGA